MGLLSGEWGNVSRTRRFLLLAFFVGGSALALAAHADAAPANPQPTTLTQPDGATFRAVPWGDEHSNGYETTGGYTIVKGEGGFWFYARRGDDGQLHSTGVRPDIDEPPDGIAPHQRPDVDQTASRQASSAQGVGKTPPGGGHTGDAPTLVILASFTNRGPIGTNEAYWADRFFGASGSVKDFYNDASFGALNVVPAAESSGTANNGIVNWVNIGATHPNPHFDTNGNVTHDLARDAIAAADASVNFASFDTSGNGVLSPRELHVIVILAGYETSYRGDDDSCEPSVWGHNWEISAVTVPTVDGVKAGGDGGTYSMFGEWHCGTGEGAGNAATVGIMAHELGHDLGFPDLYDTNGGSEGVGSWSVMGSGSWLNVDGFADGSMPPMPDAFSKYYQGWISPTAVTGTLNDVAVLKADANPVAYRVLDNPNGVDWSFNDSPGTGEYFLVENRQFSNWDQALPGCGLLIWHVDETRTSGNTANATESRKLLDLEEADGDFDLDNQSNRGDAGDPWMTTTAPNGDFNNTSNPNSKLYSGTASGVSIHTDSPGCGGNSGQIVDFIAPGGGGGCTDDAMENNDTRPTGTPVSSGQTKAGAICGGDPDYFAVAATAGQTVAATLNFSHAAGDLELFLEDASGNPLDTSELAQNTETVSAVVGSTATYYLKVFGYLDAPNPNYSLTVTVSGGGGGGTTFSIADAPNKVEKDKGVFPKMKFVVSLSGASASPVSVTLQTQEGSAIETGKKKDYYGGSLTLTFAPGQTTKTVVVTLRGDSRAEAHEWFALVATTASGATAADPSGIGLILDDD